MLNKINFAIIILSCISILSNISIAQSNEQLVQEGITNYQHGNYEKAIALFNKALRNIAFSQKRIELANVSVKTEVNVSNKSNVGLTDDRFMGISDRQLIGTTGREFMGASSEDQVSNPLYVYSVISGKIFVYRGRAYLELGRTREAFNDFDKALELNPLFTEVYFRRAITYRNPEEDDLCADLKSAMNMGYRSAESLYDRLCNRSFALR